MRAMDRGGRVSILEATNRDPGPKVFESIAAHADLIRLAYESGNDDEANRQQNYLANWVAQRGTDRDWSQPGDSETGSEIMRFWKLVWDLARDIDQTRELLDSGTGAIDEWDSELVAPR
jgi:hypothetical protein